MSVSPAGDAAALRVICIADAPARIPILRAVLSTAIPSVVIDEAVGGLDASGMRHSSNAHCAVLDSVTGSRWGLDVLRELRAGGYAGGVVLVLATSDPEVERQAAQLGAGHCVPAAELAARLPDAVVAASQVAQHADDGELSKAVAELRRTQRLIAVGEMALGLQHSLNNPLAALLAEAQLLQMEELGEEQRLAVDRVVELCRRLISIVRRLDVVTAGPVQPS